MSWLLHSSISLFVSSRRLMRISLVGTVHAESGLANAAELEAILSHIRPDVIFAEISPVEIINISTALTGRSCRAPMTDRPRLYVTPRSEVSTNRCGDSESDTLKTERPQAFPDSRRRRKSPATEKRNESAPAYPTDASAHSARQL